MLDWTKLLIQRRIRKSRSVIPEERSEFERDYHRIIISASFRRLQDKTQVFPLDPSDFVRTRLTHSLEVSSLAKSLGQQVGIRLQKEAGDLRQKFAASQSESFDRNSDSTDLSIPSTAQRQHIGDILLCAGLVHDIGNPPFGHYGETTIRAWFARNLGRLHFKGRPLSHRLSLQMQQDFLKFEGNAQALRLLSKLHFVVDEYGMNLTIPLLATIIKYPYSSVDHLSDGTEPKKIGYFFSEQSTFAELVRQCGLVCRHPLSFLLEAADDIAYATADIEDGYRKDKFSLMQLVAEVESCCRQNKAVPEVAEFLARIKDKLNRLLDEGHNKDIHKPEYYALQNWLIYLQSILMQYTESAFIDNYVAIMSGEFITPLLETNLHSKVLIHLLGDIAQKYIFSSRQIVQMEIAADKIISSLLDKFIPAAIDFDTDIELPPVRKRLMAIVSDNYRQNYFREAAGKSEEERLYYRLLLITDYISGMTDGFAKGLFQQMSGF